MNSKIKSLKAITGISKKLLRSGKKTVFTNGCFDILHYGHVKYLSDCKKKGTKLIVGLNSDSSVRKIKGSSRPITAQNDRARILASLSMVDYVVIFHEKTPERLIKAIKPSVLAKGGDWKKNEIVGSAFVEKNGGRTARIPFVPGYSTTKIIERLKNA